MTDSTKTKIMNEYYDEGLTTQEIFKRHPRLTREEFLEIIWEDEARPAPNGSKKEA
jgi:uncharacterized protein (DUF433 family)